MLKTCLGDNLYYRFLCLFITIIIIGLFIFVFPSFSTYLTLIITLFDKTPVLGYSIAGGVVLILLCCCAMAGGDIVRKIF